MAPMPRCTIELYAQDGRRLVTQHMGCIGQVPLHHIPVVPELLHISASKAYNPVGEPCGYRLEPCVELVELLLRSVQGEVTRVNENASLG